MKVTTKAGEKKAAFTSHKNCSVTFLQSTLKTLVACHVTLLTVSWIDAEFDGNYTEKKTVETVKE